MSGPGTPAPDPGGPLLPTITGHTGTLLISAGDRLAALITGWLAEYHTSAETRRAYTRELRRYLGWCAEQQLDPLAARRGDVAAYASMLATTIRTRADGTLAPAPKPASLARALATLSSFYAYAVATDALPRNPAAAVRRPKVPTAGVTPGLTADEARALITAAATWGHGPTHRAEALVRLMLATGVRIGEALGAEVTDLGHHSGHPVLWVVRKGGRRAPVPIPPAPARALVAYLHTRPELTAAGGPGWPVAEAGTPLFTTATGARWGQPGAWRLIRALARTAGLASAQGIRPHSLRVTAATVGHRTGADLVALQQLLGHATLETTRRYLRQVEDLDRSPAYAIAAELAQS